MGKNETCGTCKYYEPTKRGSSGNCRKYAPRPDFPKVGEKYWCGEYEPKGSEEGG